MQITTIILIGIFAACAMYLIMESGFARVLFGLILLSNAANLFILTMSGPPAGRRSPIVLDANASYVDPLPQALILTAIVIGFGVITYMIFLLYRVFLDISVTNLKDLFEKSKRKGGEGQ